MRGEDTQSRSLASRPPAEAPGTSARPVVQVTWELGELLLGPPACPALSAVRKLRIRLCPRDCQSHPTIRHQLQANALPEAQT